MAGPWFTVQRSGDDWQRLGQNWISNGKQDCKGQIEIRVELDQPGEFASLGLMNKPKPNRLLTDVAASVLD